MRQAGVLPTTRSTRHRHPRLPCWYAGKTWMEAQAGRLFGTGGRVQEGGPVASAGSREDEAGAPGSAVLAWSPNMKAKDRWIRSWRTPA